MNLNLKGKIVIVTGGGSGIGGAITLALADEGAIPVVLGRSPLDDAFSERMLQSQPRAGFVQVDLVDDARGRAAV